MLAWKNDRKGSTALLVKGARRAGQQYWGTQCPSGGEAMTKRWAHDAQGLGSSYKQA